jgi:hypothetical protein
MVSLTPMARMVYVSSGNLSQTDFLKLYSYVVLPCLDRSTHVAVAGIRYL